VARVVEPVWGNASDSAPSTLPNAPLVVNEMGGSSFSPRYVVIIWPVGLSNIIGPSTEPRPRWAPLAGPGQIGRHRRRLDPLSPGSR